MTAVAVRIQVTAPLIPAAGTFIAADAITAAARIPSRTRERAICARAHPSHRYQQLEQISRAQRGSR